MQFWEWILKSFLLGTVQGLTEFLPVSSSGHLLLLERVLGYAPQGGSLTFVNIMLHFGTLLAVVFVFRKDLLALFRPPFRELFMLLSATIPAALVGVLWEEKIDALFAGERGLFFLFLLFGVTAVLLLGAEIAAHRKRTPFGRKAGMAMGLMQAVAVLPGLSRSGSTIAAGIFAGADAERASRFSFLMSIPIIAGGACMGLLGALTDGTALSDPMEIWGILTGMAAAAVSGYLALRLMLRVVKRANYKWFALYLLLLSLTGLWLNCLGILV